MKTPQYVLLLVVVLIVGIGAGLYIKKDVIKPADVTSQVEMKDYVNEKYDFAISYPSDWKFKVVYDKREEGVTYPATIQNVVDSYFEFEKEGYRFRLGVNNQKWERSSLASADNYQLFKLRDGRQVWRTKTPELPEIGNVPFFQFGILKTYKGLPEYDSAFSSTIVNRGDLSFSIYYGFPKEATAENYRMDIINEMDKITQSFYPSYLETSTEQDYQ